MKNINRKEIQLKLNVSHSTVSQWFSGITKPTADKMFKLKDEFNIPLEAWRDIKSYLQENNTKSKKSEQVMKGAKQ